MRRDVATEIAGSVWTHVAVLGEHVEAGAVLLVVECMKSEFPIEAPVAGKVVWLRPCAEIIEAADLVAALEVP